MLFRPGRTERLAFIADMLRIGEPSAELITRAADICDRMFSSRESWRIKALIDAEAWTDAALALLAIELPGWKLRRIAYDEGEWHCAISRERELPEWLDGAIETHHADLAMAILRAIVEGLGITASNPGDMRCKSPDSENLISCDNFA